MQETKVAITKHEIISLETADWAELTVRILRKAPRAMLAAGSGLGGPCVRCGGRFR